MNMEKVALRAAAKADYMSGLSYRQLASKYGVGLGTIARWAEKGKWKTELLRNVQDGLTEQERNEDPGTTEDVEAPIPEEEEADLPVTDFDLLRASAMLALKKINALLELDEALAPRDIKSITSALLDLKSQLNALSPRELREQAVRLKNLEKQAAQEDSTKEQIVVEFVNVEGADA